MLSRFSSLFTYVIVGLVISAAATPLNPLGDALGDGTKSLSRPQAMKPNDRGKPYGGDRDKSYGDKDKSYGDKDKSYGDKDKSYDDKDKHYAMTGASVTVSAASRTSIAATRLTRRLKLPSSSPSVLASLDLPVSLT
ncbi:hypothetical protein V8E52_008871 [Russula decolorans]